jgi:O-antigen/teichoic acid export membrane protein
MYFQILSVGNVLQNQGMLFIIQGALGPIQVAIFSTVRTIANVINQMMGFINQITWLEFNILLGEGNLKNAARLHRIGTLIQYFIASIGFIAVLIVGPQLIKLWTNGNIIIDRQLLLLFLLIIPLSASYACSAAVLASVNQIKMQAWLLLIGTIIGLVLCWILISHFGLYGAAFSTTPVYLISFYYVFKHALKITGDNRKDFIVGLKSEFIYGITVLKRKRYN